MFPWTKKWNCYSIDPHKPSVEYGVKKFKLNIKRAYGEKLPFKSNFFDVVLSLGSLDIHRFEENNERIGENYSK